MSKFHFLKKVCEKKRDNLPFLHLVGKNVKIIFQLSLQKIFWAFFCQKNPIFKFFGLDNKWITKVAKSSSRFLPFFILLKMIIFWNFKQWKNVTSQCKWITLDNKSSKSSSLDIYVEHTTRMSKNALPKFTPWFWHKTRTKKRAHFSPTLMS